MRNFKGVPMFVVRNARARESNITDFTFETRFRRLRKIVFSYIFVFSKKIFFWGRIFQIDPKNGHFWEKIQNFQNFKKCQKGLFWPFLTLFDTFWPKFDPVGSETENFEKIYQNFSKIENFENFEKFGKKI
jgi:hypothetical protein